MASVVSPKWQLSCGAQARFRAGREKGVAGVERLWRSTLRSIAQIPLLMHCHGGGEGFDQIVGEFDKALLGTYRGA